MLLTNIIASVVNERSSDRRPGRQRRYASNAERQAAYRERARARDAAVAAAACGDATTAEDLVESMLRPRLAVLEEDRARFKAERDRAEHELALATPRLERAATLLAQARSERDEARRKVASTQAELRQVRNQAERDIRRLKWTVSDLQRDLDTAQRVASQQRGFVSNAPIDSPPGPVMPGPLPPETATLNRAQRRVLQRRKPG